MKAGEGGPVKLRLNLPAKERRPRNGSEALERGYDQLAV